MPKRDIDDDDDVKLDLRYPNFLPTEKASEECIQMLSTTMARTSDSAIFMLTIFNA